MCDLDATQVLEHNEREKKQVGTLRVGDAEYFINQGFNRIGRSPVCGVIINDPTVSKVHAEIQASPEATFVSDLRSANGTTFKSLPLKPFFYYPINDGDVVTFGRVSAVYAIIKKPSERTVDVTPKITVETRTYRSARKSLSSPTPDISFDDPNESVVPGSQRSDDKRPFGLPGPPSDRQNDRGGGSDIIGESEKINERDESQNDHDSTDICETETRNIVDRQKNRGNSGSGIVGKTKNGHVSPNTHDAKTRGDIVNPRVKATIDDEIVIEKYKKVNESPMDIDNSNNIHDMETQDIVNRGSFLSKFPKRARLESSPDVFVARTEDNIYEAETQVPVPVNEPPVEPLPLAVNARREDSCIIEKSDRDKCLVIAETDDESETDNEITNMAHPREIADFSDGSITDNENEFASSTLKTVRKEEQRDPLPIRNQSVTKTSIYDAQTQRMRDYGPREIAPRAYPFIADNPDLELLPTQVLDVATSTPISRRRKTRPAKSADKSDSIETGDPEIHNAPTQIVFDKADEEIADSSLKISGKGGLGERRERSEADAVNLDDTLARNLGNIFGDESINVGPMDEPTQLMTQNLVDILKPTQIITREATSSPSIPVLSDSKRPIDDDASKPRGTERTKTKEAGTLGFVDGRAVASGDKFLCPPSSRSMEKDETRDKGPMEETESAGCHRDDDDILFGLPEVRISGTFSNPGSPTSCATSVDNDLVAPSRRKSANVREASAEIVTSSKETFSPNRLANLRSNLDETRERESPVLSIKSRIERKNKYVSRNRTVADDHDSDDDFDYDDLKIIADRLLASDSTNDVKIRRATAATKKIACPNRRTRKLPETPPSLVVTDTVLPIDHSVNGNENRITESSVRDSRKRSRRASNGDLGKKILSKESSKESRGVDARGSTEMLSPLAASTKIYAKVQLTRLNDSEVRAKKNSVIVASNDGMGKKTTRARRLTSICTKELTSSPTAQASAKSRRTIGQAAIPRVTLVNERHRILFTGVNNKDYEKIVMKLGGSVVSDPSVATVLITDKVRRTFKFLCAIAQGTKVVSIAWLIESNKAAHFLDCDNFILDDRVAETKYRFTLAKSLDVARTNKLLDGFTIIVTPKVDQPEIHELRGMIEACGGRVLVRAPRSWHAKTVIVSREDDLAAAKTLLSKAPRALKITIQSTEFILTGILRQEVNLIDHKLV